MNRCERIFCNLAVLAVFMVCVVPGPCVRADGDRTKKDLCARTMQQLQERYRHFTALEAHFKHSLKATALNQDEVEEGTVYMERGGLMRWDYSRPRGKLAIADGRDSYLYLPSENQVFVQPLPEGGQAPLALRLLTGNVDLGTEVACKKAYAMNKVVVLALGLKHDHQGIKDLEIAYDPALQVITEVFYKDALGNQISLTLTDISFPARLDSKLFHFTVPEGARVVRGR